MCILIEESDSFHSPALAMCGHLLLLLLTVLQVYSATEYYVRPTEPNGTACPGHPCLTLNEYTNDTDHYIKSNTVFTFLPGKHQMERSLQIVRVQNITLRSVDNETGQTLLVPQYLCKVNDHCIELKTPELGVGCKPCFERSEVCTNCSAIHLVNVSHSQIDGIQIAPCSPYSGLSVEHCTDIFISNAVLINKMYRNVTGHGLFTFESSKIVVDSLQVNNLSWGIVALNSGHISISNTNIQNSSRSGVLIINSDHVSVENVLLQNNTYGIQSALSSHSLVKNVTLRENNRSGIILTLSHNSDILDSLSESNGHYELEMYVCDNASVDGIHAIQNTGGGLYIFLCSNPTVMNFQVQHNGGIGIAIFFSTIIMKSGYSSNNLDDGVLFNACDIYIKNVSVEHNQFGLTIVYSISTVIINTTSNSNKGSGIQMLNAKNTNIVHVSLKYNTGYGIFEHQFWNTTITDSDIVHNSDGDISLLSGTDFKLVRTAAFLIARDSSIHLEDILFSGMSSSSEMSSFIDPTSYPVIVELLNSSATVHNCSIIRNTISFIKAFDSQITFSGEITFSHNRALAGTALIFARNNTLILTQNCKVFFIKNHASNWGGVIYIHTEEFYVGSVTLRTIFEKDFMQLSSSNYMAVSITECFIHVRGRRSDTRLVFVNNTAGKGGDVLYGGLVALGWDGDWNCLLSFKKISDMSQQSGLSTITSDPSRVCFCEDAEPDCLTVANPITRHIYPGQTITVPAVVVGQDFGTVTSSVYTKFLNTSFDVELAPGQNVTNIDQSQCSNIEYTVFSQNTESETTLVLTAGDTDILYTLDENDNQKIKRSWMILNSDPNYHNLASKLYHKLLAYHHFAKSHNKSLALGNCTMKNFYKFYKKSAHPVYTLLFVFPKEIYGYPIYKTIFFHSCPTGFTLTSEKPFKCDCNHQLQHLSTIKCHIQDQTISRSGLIWVGSDGNETVITSQQCPLDYCKQEDINVTLDDPDTQCNYNHSGTLCGGCQAGLSLVLGSNQCQRCSNTHIALLLPFAISGVVLVSFIKLTDLTVSQGTLNGLIFYANVIKANEHLLLPDKHTPLLVFISWLNLDLGVETCFFDGLSAYAKVWLQFVFPLYIWSIAGLIIVLSRYSDRVAKLMGNSSVPVLATLFLLSYVKLLRTIISALSLSILTTTDSTKVVWSTDGNIDYLGAKHTPLFVVSVGTLLFLWLPYTVVLFFGQWLYRCNLKVVNSMLIRIKPFLDAHYGPMKPNQRYWYGALLLVRGTILLFSALVPTHHASTVVFGITVCSFLLAYSAPIVYEKLVVAMFNSMFLVNLGILSAFNIFASLKHYDILIPSHVLVGIAFTQFIGLVLFKVAVAFNIWERTRQCIHRPGSAEDNGDEDWDLYEEAALLREREAEMEREAGHGGMVDSKESENETDNSFASRPTYGI